MTDQVKKILFKMIVDEIANETAFFATGRKDAEQRAAIRCIALDMFMSKYEEATEDHSIREEFSDYKEIWFRTVLDQKLEAMQK